MPGALGSRLVRVFFDGTTLQAVNTLVDRSAAELTAEELDELARTIDEARRKKETEP